MSAARVPSTGGVGERQLAILILGICPAAVVSTRVVDALLMSAGVVLVLAATSLLLPLIRRLAPEGPHEGHASTSRVVSPRILWGALLFSSCMTAAFELALNTLAPAAASRLGVYVPLISVSFLVTGRLQELAASPSARAAALDVLRNGAAFTALLIVIAVLREILGAGTFTLGTTIAVRPFFDDPFRAVGLAGGALLCLGYAAGAVRLIGGRRADAAEGGESP